MRRIPNKRCNKMLAVVLALVVAFSYSIPMSVFASAVSNTANVVKQGSELFYDKSGQKVNSFDSAAVAVSKTIAKLSGDNEFQITLQVKTKGEVQTETKEKDAAVVLVMDVSNSMITNKDGSITRLQSAKNAANDFLTNYVKDAGDAKRMVSVVEFGTSGKTVSSWINANGGNGTVSNAAKNAINDVSNKYSVNYTRAENYIKWNWEGDWWYCDYNKCALAYDWHHKSDKRYENHTHSVTRSYKDDGGTNIEAGMMLARNLLNAGQQTGGSLGEIENKSVIMLTDGVPTSSVVDSNEGATDFLLGEGGTKVDQEDYENVPSVCSTIKSYNSSVYTISYNVSDEKVNGKTVPNWLTKDVQVTGNYQANNAAALFEAFSKINEKIETTIETSRLKIEDPMGAFILFDGSNALDENATFSGNKLTLNLVKENATIEGSVKEYTYSYKVKLDTSAQGFADQQEYPTNGATTLTFQYGSDPDAKTVDFTIPSVSGKAPEVAYTIEYYKWDKETKDYPAEPTKVDDGGIARLWSQVNAPEGYAQKYVNDNYHFVEGDSVLQLIASQSGNVLKLKYMPDLADVTVEHYYKTDIIRADGSKIEGTDYVLKSTVKKENLYVGDQFEAQLISELDGVKYQLNQKSDSQTISSIPKAGKVIKLYYDGQQDLRAKTSVVVNRIYKTGNYAINTDTGRYEEVFTVSEPQEYEKNTEVKAHSTFATSTVNGVTAGYSFEKTDNGTYDADKNQVELKLGEDTNVINITFIKHADKSTLKETKVIVSHNYYLTEKKIVDGKLLTVVPETPVTEKTEYTEYYVGEHFTPEEILSYDGTVYHADSENAGKLKAYELPSGTLEINLSYHCTVAPEATSVTVNHIYRTYDKVYNETVDEETGEVTSKVETVVREDGSVSQDINQIKVGDADEKLYVGFVYTADKDGEYEGKAYTFNEKESTKDGKITLNQSSNEINLYYDITEDTREAADIEVHHTYITKLTTVEDGKIVTKDIIAYPGIIDEKTDKYAGKAGDVFDVTLQEEWDGETYTLKSENLETITLRKGTNETITIVYEREHSDLKATTLKVIHKYVEKAMSVVKGVAGYYDEGTATVAEVEAFTVDGGKATPEKMYVGEKYTVDMVPIYNGVTYTADAANPGADITLAEAEDGNSVEYKYIHTTELPKTSVVVNHHYSHKTINKVGESTVTTEENQVTMPQPYVGEDVKVVANEAGYTFQNVQVSGTDTHNQDAEHDVALTVSNAAVTVDYYYTKVTDNSVASSWKINHYYRTVDWNDNADKEYVLDEVISSSGNSYATKTITGVPNLKPDDSKIPTVELDKAQATSDFSDGYTITLQEGNENTINFYYTQRIDSRVGTVVKVVHNYYKHDVSELVPDTIINPESAESAVVLPGVLAGTYEEVFTGKTEQAWVGNKFIADKKNVFGEGENALTYQFKDANPENCTIDYLKLADAENPNLIVINYVYNYDASENVEMKVNHVYKTHDSYNDKTTDEVETAIAKFGNEQFGSWNKSDKIFTAKEIAKSGFTRQTSDENMSVSYNAGENEMTIVYTKTVSSKPSGGGGGGNGGKNNPSNPTPSTNIPDEPVPLADNPVIIEEEAVPLAEAPGNNEQIIFDEKVPLAVLPKTGGFGMAGYFGVGAVILALGAMIRRKEEKQ
ncbi:VWA domain-containing protein [Aminipila butyrica]|uniref:VWA domain-containing protein n=1 Tax=Aminipila butyrica TaxID=433296 RepID=A0A858BZS6_9FIRM|nr:VWA domain-containing protein [Aminipila butyrica]QIB70678.1 VWA domain-containing protein [Aminipila butyrica]